MRENTLHPQLQQYLDGEIPREALSAELQRQAESFDGWLRAPAPPTRDAAPAWLANRVMVSLPAAPSPPWHQRAFSFLVEPRIRIRPLTVGLAAAVIAVLLMSRPPQRLTIRTPATPVAQTVSA